MARCIGISLGLIVFAIYRRVGVNLNRGDRTGTALNEPTDVIGREKAGKIVKQGLADIQIDGHVAVETLRENIIGQFRALLIIHLDAPGSAAEGARGVAAVSEAD